MVLGRGEKDDDKTGPISGDGGDGASLTGDGVPLIGDGVPLTGYPLDANEESKFWGGEKRI